MIRTLRKVVTIVLLAIGGICVFALWMAAGQLVAPPRRSLQEYHHEWLNSPGAHGMSLHRFTANNGLVPCLFVTPDITSGPGERGKKLREQLSDSTVQLAPYGTVHATMVLLHGRKGRKEDLLPVAERFCAIGFRCILPDLPGHGESTLEKVHFATSDMEAKLPETVLAEASEQFGFPDDPATLWGMSMGGAFAIRAAAVSPERWRALIVVSSFDSLSDVIDGQLHWAGPTIPLVRKAIGVVTVLRGGVRLAEARPVDWASSVKSPVLVAHGDKDTLIPLERGKALFNAFPSSNKHWVPVQTGDHNRVLVTPMPLYATMAKWLVGIGVPQQQPSAARETAAPLIWSGEDHKGRQLQPSVRSARVPSPDLIRAPLSQLQQTSDA